MLSGFMLSKLFFVQLTNYTPIKNSIKLSEANRLNNPAKYKGHKSYNKTCTLSEILNKNNIIILPDEQTC